MTDDGVRKKVMVQYLLGELSAEERARLEDEYLEDDDVFHELVSLEHDMIDRYVGGELPETQRAKFERSYLSDPSRLESIAMAKSLMAYRREGEAAEQSDVPMRRGLRASWLSIRKSYAVAAGIAIAAILLILAGGIIRLARTKQELSLAVEELRREQANSAQNENRLQREVNDLQAQLRQSEEADRSLTQLPPREINNSVSLDLARGLDRGENEAVRFVVPAHISLISFRLIVEGRPRPPYDVVLKTADDRLIWRWDRIKAYASNVRYRDIRVSLPSHLLPTGDYIVKVSSKSDSLGGSLAGYSFQVIRR